MVMYIFTFSEVMLQDDTHSTVISLLIYYYMPHISVMNIVTAMAALTNIINDLSIRRKYFSSVVFSSHFHG